MSKKKENGAGRFQSKTKQMKNGPFRYKPCELRLRQIQKLSFLDQARTMDGQKQQSCSTPISLRGAYHTKLTNLPVRVVKKNGPCGKYGVLISKPFRPKHSEAEAPWVPIIALTQVLSNQTRRKVKEVFLFPFQGCSQLNLPNMNLRCSYLGSNFNTRWFIFGLTKSDQGLSLFGMSLISAISMPF